MTTAPAVPFLTAAEAHASAPGRSLSWVYQHMRAAGGAGGLVRSDLWHRHLESIGCSSVSFGGPGEGAAWVAPHRGDSPAVIAAWPALVALRGLGLHLLACDAARVVLTVEAPCQS